MENNDRINFEFFTALCSIETEEELRKKFKEIIAKARDFEKDNLRRDVERSMEIIRQMEDLDEEDFKLFASMQYFNKMDDAGKFCHEDLQFEAPSSVDMSGHMHLLVDVAMQERDYHDVLVVRRFLETFNRKDNHLVEAELPRLDAYIDTLDGYNEYMEQRNKKPLKNGGSPVKPCV